MAPESRRAVHVQSVESHPGGERQRGDPVTAGERIDAGTGAEVRESDDVGADDRPLVVGAPHLDARRDAAGRRCGNRGGRP